MFFLGTHVPGWLGQVNVPLFVSHLRLQGRRTFPRALGNWALDSGGFSELSLRGKWTVTPKEYVASVKRYVEEIGNLQWAASQDWMCEPSILRKTGLTLAIHQRNTIDNYLELKSLAPSLPFIPVLQGYRVYEYLDHVRQYLRRGVDLKQLPLVGVGSVCRRQGTNEICILFRQLYHAGLKMHGFGVKTSGLAKYDCYLESSDSMAWSYTARREPVKLNGHTHKNCANCLEWALTWREKLLAKPYKELGLFDSCV